MLQYLLTDNTISVTRFDQATLDLLAKLPATEEDNRRPVFLEETDPRVVAFLAEQAEAAKPKEVSMCQFRLALLDANLLTTVEKAITSTLGDQGAAARIEWEFRTVVERSQPLVATIADVLKLSAAQVDDLFLSASLK